MHVPPDVYYDYDYILLYFFLPCYLILQNLTYVTDTGYQWAPLHVYMYVCRHVCMYVCGWVTIRFCFKRGVPILCQIWQTKKTQTYLETDLSKCNIHLSLKQLHHLKNIDLKNISPRLQLSYILWGYNKCTTTNYHSGRLLISI